MKGRGASEIRRVICGEEKGHEVGDVVGMEMGQANEINFAKIKPHAGHLAQ